MYHRRRVLDRAYELLHALAQVESAVRRTPTKAWRASGATGAHRRSRWATHTARCTTRRRRLPPATRSGPSCRRLATAKEARTAYLLVLAFDPKAAYAFNNLCYLSFLDGAARTGRRRVPGRAPAGSHADRCAKQPGADLRGGWSPGSGPAGVRSGGRPGGHRVQHGHRPPRRAPVRRRCRRVPDRAEHQPALCRGRTACHRCTTARPGPDPA